MNASFYLHLLYPDATFSLWPSTFHQSDASISCHRLCTPLPDTSRKHQCFVNLLYSYNSLKTPNCACYWRRDLLPLANIDGNEFSPFKLLGRPITFLFCIPLSSLPFSHSVIVIRDFRKENYYIDHSKDGKSVVYLKKWENIRTETIWAQVVWH